MTNGRLLSSTLQSLGRHDAHQGVVYRPLELATIHDKFAAELQNMRRLFGRVFEIALAALLQDVQEKDAALARIDPIRPRLFSKIVCRRYVSRRWAGHGGLLATDVGGRPS